MFAIKNLLLVAMAVGLGTIVYAEVLDEERIAFRNDIQSSLSECLKEHNITPEEWNAAKGQELTSLGGCFVSCLFKHVGIFDSNGKFNVDKHKEMMQKYFKDDALLARIEENKKACLIVNDVEDTEEGCERALLLYRCSKTKNFMPQPPGN